MRRTAFAILVLLMTLTTSAAVKVIAIKHTGAAQTPPTLASTGGSSILTINSGSLANTFTVSTTITVPSDATFVIVGVSSYAGSADYFSGGSMTFTKGSADTAMTSAITGANSGDHSSTSWGTAMFYLTAPDTGTNKTLKWDWAGSGTIPSGNEPLISILFLKGVNQTTPVRGAAGGQGTSSVPFTTNSLGVTTNDLVVAWTGAYYNGAPGDDGSCFTWTNLTELSQLTKYSTADGAWATTTPSTGSAAYSCATSSAWGDGGIVAIAVEPS